MSTQVQNFTTPVPIFGPLPATFVDGDSETEAWLENADAVTARELGTCYSRERAKYRAWGHEP